jgi:hypothetical protein
MSLPKDVERGSRAQTLLTDPLFSEAFENVRTAIHEKWEACPLRDRDGAHELRLMLKLLGDVRAVLESTIVDGKVASAELERLNRRVLSPAQWKGNP